MAVQAQCICSNLLQCIQLSSPIQDVGPKNNIDVSVVHPEGGRNLHLLLLLFPTTSRPILPKCESLPVDAVTLNMSRAPTESCDPEACDSPLSRWMASPICALALLWLLSLYIPFEKDRTRCSGWAHFSLASTTATSSLFSPWPPRRSLR